MLGPELKIDIDRLMGRIVALGQVGALPGGGVCRLALSDRDRAGRDLLCGWMRELGLQVSIDRIGNIVGLRSGQQPGAPVMVGSHIDSVATGGIYDGALGVLAGLEIVQSLNDAGYRTRHPLAVAAFTNEEGARFAPDMMGSAVHQGTLALADALNAVGIDGARVGDELVRIGYAGNAEPESLRPRAFLELHVEQGPVLEREGEVIGAVTGVQGISWTQYELGGVSNHAGTTPMTMRCDAGVVAAQAILAARQTALELGGAQVATVGALRVEPGLVNVVPERAVFTLDLRNTDELCLREAERRVEAAIRAAAAAEGVSVTAKRLARFEPVEFDQTLVEGIAHRAKALGHRVRRMPSGAGHDAQMFAPHCPTAMIFVPSRDGLSHNVREFTERAHIEAGAAVLLGVVLDLANAG